MLSESQDSTLEQLRSMVNQILSSLDQFSKKPELRIFDQQSYSTVLGQCVTICLTTIFSLILGSSVYSIANHTLPSVQYNQEIVNNTSPYPLDINNFTLSITLLDEQSLHLENVDRYLQFELQNCLISRSELPNKTMTGFKSCTSYQMEQCQINDNYSDQQRSFFSSRNLSGYYCINTTQWKQKPIVIQGTPQSNTFQYLQIQTQVCKNTTQNKCESQEKINSYLQTIQYVFIVDGYLTQLSNFNKPFSSYITTKSSQLSISSSKKIEHNLAIYEVQTDTGFIFNEFNSETTLGLTGINIESNSYNGQYLSNHIVLISEIKYNYSRSYQKLQTLFGQLGGLWQACISFIGLLIHPIVRQLLYLKLSNRLFNLSTSQGGQQDQSYRDIKQATLFYLQNKQQSMKIRPRNVCQLILGIRTPQQIQLAHNKITQSLDLSYILRKLHEIDQLKNLLLTKEQNQLFDYLDKPSLHMDKQILLLENLEGISMAYQKIQLDQSFISRLDPNLVPILQSLSSQGQSCRISVNSSNRFKTRLNAKFQSDEIVSFEEGAQIPR